MKLTKKLLALALCLLLCLSLSVTAFAETVPTGAPSTSGIMKTLTIDDDLVSAFQAGSQSFQITIAPGTADTDNGVYAASGANATIALEFGASDMTAAKNLLWKSYTINQIFGITSDDQATAALTAHGINNAGVWIYTVTETTVDSSSGTETVTGSNPGTLTKTLSKGGESYTLRVYVENGGDSLKIKYITVWDGSKKVDPEIKPIVDPTSGETTSTTESGFIFTGSYRETFKADDNPTPDPSKKNYGAFTVTKTIGDGRGDANLSKTFKIQIVVTAASNLTADELAAGFKYTIYTEKTPTAAASLSAEQSGAYGATITVNLSDGDVFRIQELPVGCEFSVSEPDYTDSWATDHYKKVSIACDASLTTALAKDGGVHGTVTNAFDTTVIPPTGIEVNNLPFALVVVLACAGIAVVFFSRRRKVTE